MKSLTNHIQEGFYKNVGVDIPQSIKDSYNKMIGIKKNLHYVTPSGKKIIGISDGFRYMVFDEDKLWSDIVNLYYTSEDKFNTVGVSRNSARVYVFNTVTRTHLDKILPIAYESAQDFRALCKLFCE